MNPSLAPITWMEWLGRFSYFTGQASLASLRALGRPAVSAGQLYHVLAGALPLGFVAGGALGIVVWLHLHGAVATEYQHKVPEFLALGVVLEFAPLGAGLVVAGRSGASLAAELSTMRLTEQLDALETMGLPPLKHLIGPRVLACMAALPLLTITIAFVALGSSALAEMVGGSLSWTQYHTAMLRGLVQAPVVAATLKTIVFGLLIAVAGCWHGLNAPAGAEGVGVAATRGVVWATLFVLLSNVALVKVIQLLT
ncbi:MAG: ABC transporter permease [Gemmataceae bacterium]|nr:ABC transporter permease [Gemmataceae bacterium]